MSSEEPRTSSERPKGEERAVSDPSAIELDALDRLIRGGRPPHPPVGALAGALASGSEMESLAQVAFAVRDTAADDTGLNVDRTWARISAGMQAPAALRPRPLGRLRAAVTMPFAAPGPRRRLASTPWSRAASSLAAVLVFAIVAALSVLVLPGGSAQASFLDTVQELTATSDSALADALISADEAATLQRRVDAVVAALASNPEALSSIAPDQTRAALRAINRVRVALDSASPGGAPASAVATAAVLAASLAQLDAVAATVAAVVGQAESSRPAIDRPGDAPAGNDSTPPGGSGPARPGAVVDDEAVDPAEPRDDPATETRPSPPPTDQPTADVNDGSGEPDRPAAVDDSRGTESDLAGDATEVDRTDPKRVPRNPTPPNDAPTDSAPVESPPTDVAGVDSGSDPDPDSTTDGDSRDSVAGDSEVETDTRETVTPDTRDGSLEPDTSDTTEPDITASDGYQSQPRPSDEEPVEPPPDVLEPAPEPEAEAPALRDEAETSASNASDPQDDALNTSTEPSPDESPESQTTSDHDGTAATDNGAPALGEPAR